MTVDIEPHDRLQLEIEGLRSAMQSRAVIEQAKGVLMFLYQVESERAFAILRRWSMESNVKIRDLAAALMDISLGAPAGDLDAARRAVQGAMRSPDAPAPASASATPVLTVVR